MEDIAVISMSAGVGNSTDIEKVEKLFLNGKTDTSRDLTSFWRVDLDSLGLTSSKAKELSIQQIQTLVHIGRLFKYAGLSSHDNKSVSIFMGADTEGVGKKQTSKDSIDRIKNRFSSDINFIHSFASHFFGFESESVGIQTACSSSLTSLYFGCQSLNARSSDLSIVGGISLKEIDEQIKNVPGMIYSPTNICLPFDKSADGMVEANGVGFVMLKRLSDAQKDGNEILAIIDSVAINSDDDQKMSFFATSISGEMNLYKKVFNNSTVLPESLDFVEAHGTGTQLGDYAELTALSSFFENRKRKLPISSSKAQLGHCIHAAGILGLIKTILQFKDNVIFGLPNFEQLNKNFENENSNLIIFKKPVLFIESILITKLKNKG